MSRSMSVSKRTAAVAVLMTAVAGVWAAEAWGQAGQRQRGAGRQQVQMQEGVPEAERVKAGELLAFASGTGIEVVDGAGAVVKVGLAAWGPEWAYTGMNGRFVSSADGKTATGTFTGKMGRTDVPFVVEAVVEKSGERELKVRYTLTAERETGLTLFAVSVGAGQKLEGGKAVVTNAGAEATRPIPMGRGALGEAVTGMVFAPASGEGRVGVKFASPARVSVDGEARVALAAGTLAGGTPQTVAFTLELPRAVAWYASAERAPMPADWGRWFAWTATGDVKDDSALSMKGWMEAPAGAKGRVKAEGDRLTYGGKPMRFWGINVCYASTAPEKALAEKRARFYADYGINSVRLHKYADGDGWAGINSKESFTRFDPAGLERMDYFVAKLKEAGIFVKLSPTFGVFRLGSEDVAKLSWADELRPRGGRGDVTTPHGAAYWMPEVLDLQIGQMLNLLKHRNPHTGLTYAEDPAIMTVELLNEQSIFFFASAASVTNVPAIRKQASAMFTDWLLAKYGSEEKVLERWGGAGRLGQLEGAKGESFADKSVVPVGNPWFFDPDQLAGQMKPHAARLHDTMLFLYEVQSAAYARYVKALREAGYTGEIVASNWQAGRAFSHYYNLKSDAEVGIVDRHNYYGGPVPMLARPGSGSLSSGMQQVADRPFMLSEWVHTFPTRHVSEGPALIAAYGMGLQGWDVSYLFQNRDEGTFVPRLGTDQWVVMQPEIAGLFPAVSRQVIRGDVKESDVVAVRSVHVPSMFEGKLGFDDRVRQGYDDKDFDSATVPAAALAAVRSVVSFDEGFKETPALDMKKYLDGDTVVSSTKQLRWTPAGDAAVGGFFTIDTPGTQAVVGFSGGQSQKLTDATITVESEYAAVYLTAVEPQGTIKSGRLLLTAIGDTLNDDMRFAAGRLLAPGKAPIRMAPVKATIRLTGAGTPTVHVLDQDGNRTGRTLAAKDGVITLDTGETKSPYLEIVRE